jgi:hypothetical protein
VLSGAFIIIVAGLVGPHLLLSRASSDAVLLQAAEREGVLQVEWEGDSAPVIRASAGTLEIIENGSTRKYDLSAAELRKGVFSVIRNADDVTARLTLKNSAGGSRQEVSRYLGNPVASTVDPRLARLEQLMNENDSLRATLRRERARANQLRSWLDVLEASSKNGEGR